MANFTFFSLCDLSRVALTIDLPVFFRPPPGRASHLSLHGQRKVAQRKATPVLRFSSIHGRKVRAGRPGLPTRHPWRGGKWAQSIAPTLRAFSSGPHRSTGAPEKPCFGTGHPWPPSEQDPSACFASTCAQDARDVGPLEHGERSTEKSEGWRTGCAPVRRRHRDVPSANPGGRSRILSTRMCSGRVRGVAFLLVTSLWPSKEKLPAPLGGARKKTWMSYENAYESGAVNATSCAHA